MVHDRVPEEIRERLDIVDFIRQYVDLKRAGQNFKGLCPFHSEKTPSFMVSPAKQIFHCYGCHKGGDIFTFLMEREGISFPEALATLAEQAGVTLERGRSSGMQRSEKDALLAMYREAAVFFQKTLSASRKAQSYLQERGLNDGTLERFGLGYSGTDRQALYAFLKNARYTDAQMRTAGLVHFGDSGTYDFFRDRIMFPIADPQGKIVAFGGRILTSATNLPKYINSPESVLFKKSETVYGLHLAKQAIADKGYVLITEGYLDTIICHQFGFLHAVAPLGTALTSGHLKKLRRHTDKAVFVFDGDKAGIAAARRALDLAFAEGMTVKIAVLPEGEDPDTLLRNQGEQVFRRKLGSALSPVQFLIRLHKKNVLDATRAVLKLLAACPDGLMRDEALRELSDRARIHEAILRDEMKGLIHAARRAEHSPAAVKTSPLALRTAARNPEEEALLAIALAFPEKRPRILGLLEIGSIEDGTIRNIVEKMAALNSDGFIKGLHEQLLVDSTPEERSFVTRLMMSYPADEEHAERTVQDCLHGIAIRSLTRRIHDAEVSQDAQLVAELIAEKNRLVRGEKSGN